MGSGTSKAAQNQRIEKIKVLTKQLTSAKRAETKAYKEYMLASGAERMSPNSTIKAEKRKATTAAHEKWVDAQDKRMKLEKKRDKLARTNERQAKQLTLF